MWKETGKFDSWDMQMMSYDVKKSHILCHIINYKTAFFYYILESVKRQYLKIWLRQLGGMDV